MGSAADQSLDLQSLSRSAVKGRSICGISVTTVLMLVTACSAGNSTFSLINRADEPIVHARVTIAGQTFDIECIQPGGSISRDFGVKSDDHYVVEVNFLSGRTLQREVGYVTNGINFHHYIVVTTSNIQITSSAEGSLWDAESAGTKDCSQRQPR